MQPVKPIMITNLFPQERKQLLELLSEFDAGDWEKPTIEGDQKLGEKLLETVSIIA